MYGCPSCGNGCFRQRAGAWSKTMIGYGPEEEGFALELTYNYGIDGYKNGDDLQYISLQVDDIEATKAKAEAEGERKVQDEEGGRPRYVYSVLGVSMLLCAATPSCGCRKSLCARRWWCVR